MRRQGAGSIERLCAAWPAAAVVAVLCVAETVHGASRTSPTVHSFADANTLLGKPGGTGLIRADEVTYDTGTKMVTAEGHVEIDYNDRILLADKVTYDHIGYNSRLDELQAAILRVLLPELDGWADARRAAGRAYEEAGLGEVVTLPAVTPAAAFVLPAASVPSSDAPAAVRPTADPPAVPAPPRGSRRRPRWTGTSSRRRR